MPRTCVRFLLRRSDIPSKVAPSPTIEREYAVGVCHVRFVAQVQNEGSFREPHLSHLVGGSPANKVLCPGRVDDIIVLTALRDRVPYRVIFSRGMSVNDVTVLDPQWRQPSRRCVLGLQWGRDLMDRGSFNLLSRNLPP